MNKIAVIDYGMGNLHSVAKAVEHVAETQQMDVQIDVTSDPQIIAAADRVIFPGVGAIRDCMAEILRLGIDDIVSATIKSKPMLAICVGFQALMESSEENNGVECLGLVKGQVKYFGDNFKDTSGQKLKVPHMGWNIVKQTSQHPLWKNIADNSRFYFVHSYYVAAAPTETVSGTTDYGIEFAAALEQDNVFAVQFHPEKSQHAGLTLLTNFLHWDGSR
jgi:glutamine amidotransferase